MIRYFLLSILLVFNYSAYSQEKLTDLGAPSSPASAVLGIQPSSVLSPKSYKALETALFSNFLNSTDGIIVPSDFGIEFTPYWTGDHSLSITEYLYPKTIWDGQIKRNSSFSLASTQNFMLGDSSLTSGIGFGYRTTLYFGDKKQRLRADSLKSRINQNQLIQATILGKAQSIVSNMQINTRDDFIRQMKPVIIDTIVEMMDYTVSDADVIANLILDNLPSYDPQNPDPFLDLFNNLVNEHLKEADSQLNSDQLFERFEKFIRSRYGFSMDIAYGVFLNFPDRGFNSMVVPRQSLWVNPTYRFRDEQIDFLKLMIVLKYEWFNTGYFDQYFPGKEVFENNFDYGLGITGEFENFSMELEFVGRRSATKQPAGTDMDGNELFFEKTDSDFQAIGSLSYRINKQITLTYSLGDRFESIGNLNDNLVSLLTMNFGFGGPTRDTLDI